MNMMMSEIEDQLCAYVELFKDDTAMRQLIREWKINRMFVQSGDEIETLQLLVLGLIRTLIKHKMLKKYEQRT